MCVRSHFHTLIRSHLTPVPDFAQRAHADEMMDDFAITDRRLTQALDEIRLVNRLLGGYAASMAVLRPFLKRQGGRPTRLLDVGTGSADLPEHLVRWADRHGADVRVVAVDANPATVDYAREALGRRLPSALRDRIRVEVGDALALPYEAGSFDVAHAAMFVHHFERDRAVALLREMRRTSRQGLVVNDLHRHPLGYYGIWALARAFPVSPMFRHDAPLSVLRGFRRDELCALAAAAGLPTPDVRWHWAFRWTLSTVG